jgi:CRP-like cAMP-binding protein
MPSGTPPWQLERGRSNRFLAILPPHDFSRLAPHLRTVTLERGAMLHEAGAEIERVYFPHSGMVSLVTVMQSGTTVETATIGRAGVIGANTGLGAKQSVARAIVQLPGTAAWLSASCFHAAANQSQAIRELLVRYNDLLLVEVQQSVACNALHAMEARLCRWLLQAQDGRQCHPGDAGVSRTDARRAPHHRDHRGATATEHGSHPVSAWSHPNYRSPQARGTLL